MGTRAPFAINEWYHCYNRGVDKRVVFENTPDYERFLTHMYLGNGTKNIRVSMLPSRNLDSLLIDERFDRGEPIVEIGAYSLMPNHFHFLLKEIREGGIATFMQKVFTGYTMYFNNKRTRTGALFAGTFKSRHVDTDEYLKQVMPYILLNPVELFEPEWKTGAGDLETLKAKLKQYRYSSLPDFMGDDRPLSRLVGDSIKSYYDSLPTIELLLEEGRTYTLQV